MRWLGWLVLVLPACTTTTGAVDDDHDGIAAAVDCDDHDVTAGEPPAWFADTDGDGWGDDAGDSQSQCDAPDGYAPKGGDCDDANPSIHPDATEACNDVDDDCDGVADDDVSGQVYYADVDGDGFGDPEVAVESCAAEAGFVKNDGDCDDDDAAVHPSADEQCNHVDDDCDGEVDDDAVDALSWYGDADGDDYGNTADLASGCEVPDGSASIGGDCNDSVASIHPGAPEVCDDIDQDCSGVADDDAIDMPTWYHDADSDGFGDDDVTKVACDQPAGYTDEGGDCNDANADLTPETLWYADVDGDGYGDATNRLQQCEQPSGYLSKSGDCDDARADVYPGVDEVCNGRDDDCDGLVDVGATDEVVL